MLVSDECRRRAKTSNLGSSGEEVRAEGRETHGDEKREGARRAELCAAVTNGSRSTETAGVGRGGRFLRCTYEEILIRRKRDAQVIALELGGSKERESVLEEYRVWAEEKKIAASSTSRREAYNAIAIALTIFYRIQMSSSFDVMAPLPATARAFFRSLTDVRNSTGLNERIAGNRRGIQGEEAERDLSCLAQHAAKTQIGGRRGAKDGEQRASTLGSELEGSRNTIVRDVAPARDSGESRLGEGQDVYTYLNRADLGISATHFTHDFEKSRTYLGILHEFFNRLKAQDSKTQSIIIGADAARNPLRAGQLLRAAGSLGYIGWTIVPKASRPRNS
ncbi:hypothetical protein FB451DRAFT_1183036 [Mycena latifolia]|nr:hypothetical protein FB451DRAFT_1183036 [Mycena latifolia]